MPFKLAVIVGSLRKDSSNRKLARALAALGAGKFEAQFLEIGDLPLFNEDLEASVPAPVTRLKQGIEGADAVLIVTPEYNRALPGVLKNAIDWASRPYGKNSFAGKPGVLAGVSPGALGASVAQNGMKATLNYLGIDLMGTPEMYLHFKPGMIDADGNIADEGTKKFLQGYVDTFTAWIEARKK